MSTSPPDVLHLTGHAGHAGNEPVFELESIEGALDQVTPERLSRAFPTRPRLAFFSGCRTAQSPQNSDGNSIAERLIRDGWPAVLGWGNNVGDTEASFAAEQLYGQLDQGESLPLALLQTWLALRDKRAVNWHLLRLHCDSSLPDRLVTPRNQPGRRRPTPTVEQQFLDPVTRQSKVADRQSYVGRRRLLQEAVQHLRRFDSDHIGLLLYGQGGRGKSSTAARICDRLGQQFSRVVVVGRLDEQSLVSAIVKILPATVALLSKSQQVKQGLQDKSLPLGTRLALALTEAAGLELRQLLFVLDDFEQNQPNSMAGDLDLSRVSSEVLSHLVEACQATQGGRILITGRYLLPEFWHPSIAHRQVEPLTPGEQDKQQLRQWQKEKPQKSAVDLLPEVRRTADGNPRLYEWLFQVLRCPGLDHAGLVAKLAATEAEFRAKVLLDSLVASLPLEGQQVLARLLVFEEPIPEEWARTWCGVEGGPDAGEVLSRCIALGLVDRSLEHGKVSVRAVRQLARGNPPALSPVPPDVSATLARQAIGSLDDCWWNNGECDERWLAELVRVAVLANDQPRVVRFARTLSLRLMNADRARECLDLVNPILELSGRDPILLLQAARAEGRVGDGVRCDSLLEEASQHADQLPGDERAEIWFWQAERLISRGDSDRALNLFEGSLIPLLKELNQTRELAIAMGKIADIRQARGELDEALRIRMQEELPVYERLGDVRSKAITMGQIADIRQARGELDEALRIRMQEVLPVFERLGDVREVIVARVNTALVLAQRGRAEDVAQVVEMLFTSLAEAKRYGFAEAEQIEAIIQQIMGK